MDLALNNCFEEEDDTIESICVDDSISN